MTNEQIWEAVLGEIELTVSKPNFTTWFKNTFILENKGSDIVIGVPNAFTKAWLENKYRNHIIQALQHITGMTILTLSYRVETERPATSVTPPTAAHTAAALRIPQRPPVAPQKQPTARLSARLKLTHAATVQPTHVLHTISQVGQKIISNLNPKYTFQKFVVGKTNELAHAASLAVAQQPGQAYNPLFIYGGVGLGKTHLMQAIGHEILLLGKGKSVLYVSSETFTNEFISSIREGKGGEFKNKYRSVDALFVDDIQFISGKEQTQEEFFHTFNHLHQLNKQVVITSDRLPKAIADMEGRLLSRFEWGMVVDVSAPDLETRIAILSAKCNQAGAQIPPEVVNYIASNIQNNIRQLEGALNRVIAFQQLNHVPPTLENVKEILNSIITPQRSTGLTSAQILRIVSDFYDLKSDDLVGNSRKKSLVMARQVVMYLMRQELKSSYPDIGNALGGRDHTTAMHACSKILVALKKDDKIRQDVRILKEKLYQT